MDVKQLSAMPWFQDVVKDVQLELERLGNQLQQRQPDFDAEGKELESKIQGWSVSLAKPDLDLRLRTALEQQLSDALARLDAINSLHEQHEATDADFSTNVEPGDVVDRLNRLDEVLAKNNPTVGNIELALHVDRIACFQDGRVLLRTTKLGAIAGARDIMEKYTAGEATVSGPTNIPRQSGQSSPRKRTKRNTGDMEGSSEDLAALLEYVSDPERFGGLDERWFWTDEFKIPEPTSWVSENAERVFKRRQEKKWSFAKLAEEFGRTAPTMRAAVLHYLETHPGETDDVHLSGGGKRPRKIHVEKFAQDARELWEAGAKKEALAEKYHCSTPMIDQALSLTYQQDGLRMPRNDELRAARVARARKMVDEGHQVEDVAKEMRLSVGTIETYVRETLVAEGKRMTRVQKWKSRNEAAMNGTSASEA